jgi:hypothetical protein
LTLAAFWLAYVPLEGKQERLSLAITAMAAVGYMALNFETMLFGRRQALALIEQVGVQQEELEHNKAALARQIEDAAKQTQYAEEARDAARRSLLETVYARYDAAAPQVSVSVQGDQLFRQFTDVSGAAANMPPFIERDDFESYQLLLIALIDFYNYGPNAVLVTNAKKTSGRFTDSDGNQWPDVWLLRPSYDSDRPLFRWRYEGTVGHLLATMGQAPLFGVECVFEVRDLIGNVTDTHTLHFRFTAIEKDGSRAKMPPAPVPIVLKDLELRDTGGVASVERKYRDPLG